jgi:hypothetical protein
MAGREISKDRRICTLRTVSKHAYISYGTEPHPTLYLCKIIHVFFWNRRSFDSGVEKRAGACLLGGKTAGAWGYRWKLYLYQ